MAYAVKNTNGENIEVHLNNDAANEGAAHYNLRPYLGFGPCHVEAVDVAVYVAYANGQ